MKNLTLSSPISSSPFSQKQRGHAYVHFVSLKEQDTYVSQLYAGAAGHKVNMKAFDKFVSCMHLRVHLQKEKEVPMVGATKRAACPK